MTRQPERRILSVWWPRLAIERWEKAGGVAPEAPVVLTLEGAHGPVLHAVTRAAAKRGARPGARLTDARAVDPELIAVAADPAGDAALVERLARWAGRWSPLVEIDGPDGPSELGTGLRLDVTGIAHLFGDEAALVEDVRVRFAGMGLTTRTAIAPTAAAAWALARFPSPLEGEGRLGEAERGEGVRGRSRPHPPTPSARVPPSPSRGEGLDDLAALLAPLPVAALKLSPQSTRTLERLGLKTIGALVGVPRRALARRFREADNPIDALDRLLGRKPEPLTAAPFAPPPRSVLRLEEPVADPAAASQALALLMPKLVEQLERRRLGARRLALTGFRVDGGTVVASVATAIPSREPSHLRRLLAERAAALDPGFGFDGFALEACRTEPLGAAQHSLVEEPAGTAEVALLVDRLSVKLGPERVRRPVARASHLPERASGWVSDVSSLRGAQATKQSRGADLDCFAPLAMTAMRPQRLLDRPEAIAVVYATPEGLPRRFVWRHAVHDIARVEGPERIAPEWWRERSGTRLRDYYRVEDASGRRYWIFREGVIGDGRGGAPAWYLHGLFG